MYTTERHTDRQTDRQGDCYELSTSLVYDLAEVVQLCMALQTTETRYVIPVPQIRPTLDFPTKGKGKSTHTRTRAYGLELIPDSIGSRACR